MEFDNKVNLKQFCYTCIWYNLPLSPHQTGHHGTGAGTRTDGYQVPVCVSPQHNLASRCSYIWHERWDTTATASILFNFQTAIKTVYYHSHKNYLITLMVKTIILNILFKDKIPILFSNILEKEIWVTLSRRYWNISFH